MIKAHEHPIQKASPLSQTMNKTIKNFIRTIKLTGQSIHLRQIELRELGCPHAPTTLPAGKMAVYIFRHGDAVLKIGKVGPNSNARFRTQRYFPDSSMSNLAKSLLNDQEGLCIGIDPAEIGSWMKINLFRTDIL